MNTPNTSGRLVVDKVLGAIEAAGIFPPDQGLLRRIAWVESKFGTDANTYKLGYHGGIWQVDKPGFEDTKDKHCHPGLKEKYKQIKEKLDVDWTTVKWEDLTKPLYSGLAARLYLSNVPEAIPSDLAGQANYWKDHYNSHHPQAAGTWHKFKDDVDALENGKR